MESQLLGKWLLGRGGRALLRLEPCLLRGLYHPLISETLSRFVLPPVAGALRTKCSFSKVWNVSLPPGDWVCGTV